MAKYVVYAQFDGDEEYNGTRSQRVHIETSMPTYRIQFVQKDFEKGVVNKIEGKILNTNGVGIAHNNLTLKITDPQGTVTTNTITANSTGSFSYNITPSRDGIYTVQLTANATNEYYQAVGTAEYVCGQKNTKITIDLQNKTIISNNQILVSCIVEDSDGNSVANVPIKLYEDGGVTPVQTLNTNRDGAVTFKRYIKEIGSHYFIATFDGSTKYKGSTTLQKDATVEIVKHTITIQQHDTITYPNWKLRWTAVQENGGVVGATGFNVAVTNNGQTNTYTLRTDENGYMETPSLNLQEGETTVRITGGSWAYHERVDSSFKVQSFDGILVDTVPQTISNGDVNIPYKPWVNLNNIAKEDLKVARCGTICQSDILAGKNGSRNTPATIICSNHDAQLDIGNIVDVDKLEIKIKCRTISCSSASAKPGVTPPTLKMNNRNYSFTTTASDGQIPFNTLGWITCTIENLTSTTLQNLNYQIVWNKNTNTNPGIVEIDQITCTLNYKPAQEDVE